MHRGTPVGFGVFPEIHAGVFEFNTGSVFGGTAVGCGFGVTVRTVGAKVVPPMIVVRCPFVSVAGCSTYVKSPQTTVAPGTVVVWDGPMIEVVPLMTLKCEVSRCL